MGTRYRIRFFEPDGTFASEMVGSTRTDLAERYAGFAALAYTRRVNAPGTIVLAIPGNHEILTSLAINWLIEVSVHTEIGWSKEIVGIYRWGRWSWNANAGPVFIAECPGVGSWLATRHVMWYANTTNRSVFLAQDVNDIVENLVRYNLGATEATTANGRLVDGTHASFTTYTLDVANTKTATVYCAFANLLTVLQAIAKETGDDFEIIPNSTRPEVTFKWFNGSRGTDRRSELLFSMARGNMANPTFEEDARDEATVFVVGGQGEQSDRDIGVVLGSDFAIDNKVELFVDAKNITQGDTAGLQAVGTQKSERYRRISAFQFEAIEDTTRYRQDFDLGDLAYALNPFNGQKYTVQCDSITVTLDGGSGDEKVVSEFITK